MIIKELISMNLLRIFSAMALIILFSGCIGQGDGGAPAGEKTKTNFSVVVYHGVGCPHCANTITLLNDLSKTYEFQMELKEIKYNPENMKEFNEAYGNFGVDAADGGIPTLIINRRTMVIGEVGRETLTRAIRLEDSGMCPSGAYTTKQFSDLMKNMSENQEVTCNATNMTLSDNANKTEARNSGEIPLMVLVPAAIADSINPCTMAIMAMLLAITLQKEGKNRVLLSGIIFTSVIFICYLLMGIGIMQVVGDVGIQRYFFYIMIAITAIMTILEIKAFSR